MNTKKIKVLIAAGGSGGHIFPAIAVAEELEKYGDAEIIFAASKRTLDRNILDSTKYRKILFSVNPMPYKPSLQFIPFFFKCIYDVFLAMFSLLKEKPDMVVGFGGYTSGTIVLLASMMKIKTVIHEQNVVPGRANRLLDRAASAVCISFENSKEYFKNKNVIFTGNPLRKSINIGDRKAALRSFYLSDEAFTILIMGGSQGARTLNKVAKDALIGLDPDIRSKMQVIHIAGKNDAAELAKVYASSGVRAKVVPFLENIFNAYNACDIAVSRSGAAALFELAFYGKPMILVPYPSKKNSQRLNAKYFSDRGAAIAIDHDELTPERLRDAISLIFMRDAKKEELSRNARKLAVPDSSGRMARAVFELLGIQK